MVRMNSVGVTAVFIFYDFYFKKSTLISEDNNIIFRSTYRYYATFRTGK